MALAADRFSRPGGLGVYRTASSGYALLLVLLFAGAGLLVLGGMIEWSASKARLADRFNRYQEATAVAEAATEKVISRMIYDYQQSGPLALDKNLKTYGTLQPNASENPQFGRYEFTLPQGSNSVVLVEKLTDWTYTNLASFYSGLCGTSAFYRVVSRASTLGGSQKLSSAVGQEVQLASIPIFQFAVFYASDLEISPGRDMEVNGRVHGNGNLYLEPNQCALKFNSAVTSSKKIYPRKNALDPVVRTPGSILYLADWTSDVKSLNLPLGTNNDPVILHALIDLPTPSEPQNSPLAQQRFYNRADLIILISNTTSVAMSGAYNNFSTTIPWSDIAIATTRTSIWSSSFDWSLTRFRSSTTPQTGTGFVSTNVSFFNKRENKTVQATEVDLQRFLAQYSALTSVLGRKVSTLYIADLRTSATAEPGIRIIKGNALPISGLTIATPNPLYVQGDFNVTPAVIGVTNLLPPAALVGDALTFLSVQWTDENSSGSLSQRGATNSTLNASLIAGIVPTGGGYYSGGVENAIRLLEDWTGQTLALNGSLVVLYPSRTATAPWGASAEVYNPPSRKFTFDQNLLEVGRLPPSTPELRTMIRTKWSGLNPDSLR